jgi:hypothetical protein
MWDAYYRYNYADAWNPTVAPWNNAPAIKDYNRRNIYDPSISGDTEYGYRGDARSEGGNRAEGGEKVPFFNNITVYGMWAGNYIAYTLINPIITQFDHDTYDYADGAGTMQNRMTIDYETVVYNTGEIGDIGPDSDGSEEVAGFAGPDSYDRRESPLLQGGNNLFGPFPPRNPFDEDSISDFIGSAYSIYDNAEGIVDSVFDAAQAGLTEAVLNALGLGGDTDTPTNGATPSIVNIANQGIVTGANNNNTQGSPPPAGSQNNGNGTGGA